MGTVTSVILILTTFCDILMWICIRTIAGVQKCSSVSEIKGDAPWYAMGTHYFGTKHRLLKWGVMFLVEIDDIIKIEHTEWMTWRQYPSTRRNQFQKLGIFTRPSTWMEAHSLWLSFRLSRTCVKLDTSESILNSTLHVIQKKQWKGTDQPMISTPEMALTTISYNILIFCIQSRGT